MASHATGQIQETRLPWGLILIEGVALLLLGILLMVKPDKTSVIVVQFLGLYGWSPGFSGSWTSLLTASSGL